MRKYARLQREKCGIRRLHVRGALRHAAPVAKLRKRRITELPAGAGTALAGTAHGAETALTPYTPKSCDPVEINAAIQSLTPLAVQTLREVMESPKASPQTKTVAANSAFDRAGFTPQKRVRHEHFHITVEVLRDMVKSLERNTIDVPCELVIETDAGCSPEPQ
jgi:hypothetical protein